MDHPFLAECRPRVQRGTDAWALGALTCFLVSGGCLPYRLGSVPEGIAQNQVRAGACGGVPGLDAPAHGAARNVALALAPWVFPPWPPYNHVPVPACSHLVQRAETPTHKPSTAATHPPTHPPLQRSGAQGWVSARSKRRPPSALLHAARCGTATSAAAHSTCGCCAIRAAPAIRAGGCSHQQWGWRSWGKPQHSNPHRFHPIQQQQQQQHPFPAWSPPIHQRSCAAAAAWPGQRLHAPGALPPRNSSAGVGAHVCRSASACAPHTQCELGAMHI